MTGWSVYFAVNIFSSIVYRHQPDFMGYCAFRGALLVTSFLMSFVMRRVCHWLWQKKASVPRVVIACFLAAYPMGVLSAAAAFWSEINLAHVSRTFRWSTSLVAAPSTTFTLLAWSGLYFGIRHYFALEEKSRQLVAAEMRALEAQSMAREMQLRALRYQLQPHFLFNTLNAISTLVLEDQPAIATEMISHLAELLRSTLDSPNTDHVSLAEEIRVTEQYLAIEEIRFGSQLQVEIDIEKNANTTLVPRLLLQPLVENAIRHGIAKRADGGELTIRARSERGMLTVRITNELAEFTGSPTQTGERAWGGLGLLNVRKRLEQVYGHEGTLTTRSTQDGLYEAIVSLPLQYPSGSVA